MLILGIESSAKTASAALSRDGALFALYEQRSGLTHSRTLLPMAQDLLKSANMAFSDLDAVAVAHGPGSFTGVRIGVATAKGLCWGAGKPAIGVSTLEAMAFGGGEGAPAGAVICCAMDARRDQIYNALFRWDASSRAPVRLTPDRAISLAALRGELETLNAPVYVLGDGAALCFGDLEKAGLPARLAPENVRFQTAWGVCRAAEGRKPRPAGELLPVYLRLSQAERERQARLEKEGQSPSGQEQIHYGSVSFQE